MKVPSKASHIGFVLMLHTQQSSGSSNLLEATIFWQQ
jgi:hypothetical protein